MLDKVVLRLTELLKEKNIIDKNEKDIDKIVNLLSKKTSIPLNTLTNIIWQMKYWNMCILSLTFLEADTLDKC